MEVIGSESIIPINYQYPLSAAIYRVLQRADGDYAHFLHNKGYGKGFKLFTFSSIECAFKLNGDRLQIIGNSVVFEVAFYLPKAIENFIKGLFQTAQIDIADAKSRGSFRIVEVEAVPSALSNFNENEIVSVDVEPLSAVVAGIPNENGNYNFLSPRDERYIETVIYNWREKIKACFDEATSGAAFLLAEVSFNNSPPKSRLMTIKAGSPQETKIKGYLNFKLSFTSERRFLEVVMNCGVGVYNSLGCGMVRVVKLARTS